ncbi:aspartate/glutamate racemase family protein [Aminithiophilus ramosus]|uniref:Aspartate/glutamate racemase family protein n=3 Tax=Synergistales TaxID=649776 RepID=A0A9Q7AH34_9BACT|nr:aspartate/glutamate racemase family protein [Aminithiophilus ramosus]QTX31835.1 aspartate/glutamate racemase family protein [Aminithiophilus ramosus]QVL37685.1 aspartate/glutamate racemase family protein [Synergistota bacterium]
MTVYRIKSKSRSWDGEPIGILILDAAYPCVPGNVGNATTFPFPVRYKEIRGSSIERLLNERDPELLKPFIEGAKELEAEGVRAITGACGFMALFQRQVAEAVEVPVFLSSLLQVPFIYRTLTSKQKVGVITASARCLTDEHYANVGITKEMPLVVCGMEDQEEFRTSVLEEKGTMDSDLVEREVVSVAERMVADNPEVGAIVLECSDLPPYAHAVHKATGRPVFDFITMIKYVHSALTPRPYEGYM